MPHPPSLPGGSHPFGATFERDYNILSGHPNLSALSHWPEAVNLIGAMISKDPKRRPSIEAVRAHLVWWTAQQALLFVIQVSFCFVGYCVNACTNTITHSHLHTNALTHTPALLTKQSNSGQCKVTVWHLNL